MKLSFAIAERSNRLSQDRAVVFSNLERSVLALADGAGGVGNGALAAECVVNEARAFFEGAHASARDALCVADAKLMQLGCLSTGIMIEVRDGTLVGASAGDSVAWLITDGSLSDLTQQQRRKPLLGDGALPVEFSAFWRIEGATRSHIFLASDGLANYANHDAILRLVRGSRDLRENADSLVELPRLQSGDFPDDTTVLLARLLD